jgi:hypothetical protein
MPTLAHDKSKFALKKHKKQLLLRPSHHHTFVCIYITFLNCLPTQEQEHSIMDMQPIRIRHDNKLSSFTQLIVCWSIPNIIKTLSYIIARNKYENKKYLTNLFIISVDSATIDKKYTASQLIDTFERVQRQAVRFISGNYTNREDGYITNLLERPALQHRREVLNLIFLFK